MALTLRTPTRRITEASIADAFNFIRDRIAQTAVCPTYDEIRLAMGFLSKAQVSRLLAILEKRGKIRRLPKRQRAIEIVQKPRPGQFGVPEGQMVAAVQTLLARRKLVPVLDTTKGGYRFFVVQKFGDSDPILLELVKK